MLDLELILLDNEDYDTGRNEANCDTEDCWGQEGLDSGSLLGLLAG